METVEINRQIEGGAKVYIIYTVPPEGFTVKVTIEKGDSVVCGSTFLERPDCSYSPSYDWKLEGNNYHEIFLDGNGLPCSANEKCQVQDVKITNVTVEVYITIEGVGESNTFRMNTSIGDTTTIQSKFIACKTEFFTRAN